MGKILIVEEDAVFAAVLEDRLQVLGHEVELVADRGKAMDAATARPADLLILEIGQPGNLGLDVVTALRGRPDTRALPILVLSKSIESSDRVAALKAGADDYLTTPCDLEELILRAERLTGGSTGMQPVLQGDLSSHPLWELVQFLQQAGQSGSLVLRGASTTGRVHLRKGKLVGGQWEGLPAQEALLAIFGLKRGTFRFVAAAPAADGETLPTHEILMDAAWLEDEIEKRREHLPVTGVPLKATGKTLPAAAFEDVHLPFEEILSAVNAARGVRIFDLVNRLPWAPQRIRLAVAWMVEQGILETPIDASAQAYPTTTEITSSQLTELSVMELLVAAREAGLGTSALPFIILVEPGNWAELLELVTNVPGFPRNDALKAFADELKANLRGSVTFPVELGKLVLHVNALDPAVGDEIESNTTVAGGVYLWLDDGAEGELARRVIERFNERSEDVRGLVVAAQPTTLKTAEQWIEGKRHWRSSSHAPQSLLGVFRLLEPGPSA